MWKITDNDHYALYDALEKRPLWWPQPSKNDQNKWVIYAGERWCRIKNERGAQCPSPKFATTTNLRAHINKHHDGIAKSKDGAIPFKMREFLIEFYFRLATPPRRPSTPPTLSAPHLNNTEAVITPSIEQPTTPQPVEQKRPFTPRRNGRVLKKDARIGAGLPDGCSSCKPMRSCPQADNSDCEVNAYYTDASEDEYSGESE